MKQKTYLTLKFRSRTIEMMVYLEYLSKSLRNVEVNNIVNIGPNNSENIRPQFPIHNVDMFVIDLENSY